MMQPELKNAYIHITESCEHHCDFCYAANGLGNFGHAKLNQLKRIIAYLSRAGVKKLSLVGGNPTLHPDILEIVKYIRNETEMKTILMTNTANFPTFAIKDVAKYVDTVMVTVHGDNSIQHDGVTKVKGSYDSLIESCKEFQKSNVNIEIAFNITPNTYNQIVSSVKAFQERGVVVNRLVLQRIVPIMTPDGTVLKSNIEYVPNKHQVNIALEQMEIVLNNYHIPVELVDPFPYCIVKPEYRYLLTPCKCGWTDLSINGKGNISRCGANPNYSKDSILDSDQENPVLYLWENSKILKDFRNKTYLPEICKTCAEKSICGAGCEASCNAFNKYDRMHLDIFEREDTFIDMQ